MKDGLNSFGSEAAALLNQHEWDELQGHAEIPQRLAESINWMTQMFIGQLVPDWTGPAKPLIQNLVGSLARLAGQKQELNVQHFAYCVVSDFERLHKSISELQKSERNVNLLVQGALEARSSASKQRVERLASVAVSGLLRDDDPEEMASEFLRFTSLLADSDVRVLYMTASLQKPLGASTYNEDQWRHEVFTEWPELLGGLVADGISQMSYRRAFVRLQGLGLLEPMDPGFSGGKPRYEVLELGRQYLIYLNNYQQTT